MVQAEATGKNLFHPQGDAVEADAVSVSAQAVLQRERKQRGPVDVASALQRFI